MAQLGLTLPGLESPSRVSLTAWQRNLAVWELPVKHMGEDSCVVMFWDDKVLQPEEKRYVGFTYGLGRLEVGPRQTTQNQLGLTLSGSFHAGKEFTVLAYVHYPESGQKLKLTLDPGLELVKSDAEQAVPQGLTGSTSLVTWRVHAGEGGQYGYSVQSGETKQDGLVFITTPAAGKTYRQVFD